MQTLYLPHHPEKLDLPALNKRLRAGTLCLDWSDMEASFSPIQLAVLLSGPNLAEHADLIGVATVPSFLQCSNKCLDRLPPRPHRQTQ